MWQKRTIDINMRASVAIILGAILLFGGFTVWYFLSTQESIQKMTNDRLTFIAESDVLIEETNAERLRQQEEINRIRRDPSNIGVIVNKKHPIEPVSYEPQDLVTSKGATLSKKAITDFRRMYDDAAAAGQPFYVTSSYRSYQTQVSTYGHWVSVSGQKKADTYSARPGYSEHQTGFVIDVAAAGCTLDCFGSTSQYRWLQDNAAEYGFIQRYYGEKEATTGYKAEEWHYRYVGVDVAKDMKEKSIKSLEEYWGYRGGDYDE